MTWVPSDELVQDAYAEFRDEDVNADDEEMVWAVFRAVNRAVERGELVPRERLERLPGWYSPTIGLHSHASEQQAHPIANDVPLYRIIEPAQPNDGGDS